MQSSNGSCSSCTGMRKFRGEGIPEYSIGHACMYGISPMRHLIGILRAIWLASGWHLVQWHLVGIWLASGWHSVCLALVWYRIGQSRIGLFSHSPFPTTPRFRKPGKFCYSPAHRWGCTCNWDYTPLLAYPLKLTYNYICVLVYNELCDASVQLANLRAHVHGRASIHSPRRVRNKPQPS